MFLQVCLNEGYFDRRTDAYARLPRTSGVGKSNDQNEAVGFAAVTDPTEQLARDRRPGDAHDPQHSPRHRTPAASGDELAARLDLPAGAVRAYGRCSTPIRMLIVNAASVHSQLDHRPG
jgi:hypothetical protein